MAHLDSTPPALKRRQQPRWLMIAFYVAIVLLLAWLGYFNSDFETQQGQRPSSTSTKRNDDSAQKSTETGRRKKQTPAPKSTDDRERRPDREDGLLIRNVKVFDENDKVVYRGDVDLAPTLERIERGVLLRFSHDGIIFENRERRLPKKPSGYYHEFVQPTPKVNGPGAQRVVLGRDGEVYYSSDHYRTFRRIR